MGSCPSSTLHEISIVRLCGRDTPYNTRLYATCKYEESNTDSRLVGPIHHRGDGETAINFVGQVQGSHYVCMSVGQPDSTTRHQKKQPAETPPAYLASKSAFAARSRMRGATKSRKARVLSGSRLCPPCTRLIGNGSGSYAANTIFSLPSATAFAA
jgi:hypothetical protein